MILKKGDRVTAKHKTLDSYIVHGEIVATLSNGNCIFKPDDRRAIWTFLADGTRRNSPSCYLELQAKKMI